ncbi:hypothetical protein NLU13_9247 [Sarocladium strictum]|uniref:Uncharacterized protein n=1 Tax=Sarocladium strictum TaxID=5046 RepID=A0AA39GB64_SARSR|nr:hypothetical protein NLU13_9247 [Sarocladium strictum]
MPEVNISLDEEQKRFDAEVAAIEKQWASPRQAHLKRPYDAKTVAALRDAADRVRLGRAVRLLRGGQTPAWTTPTTSGTRCPGWSPRWSRSQVWHDQRQRQFRMRRARVGGPGRVPHGSPRGVPGPTLRPSATRATTTTPGPAPRTSRSGRCRGTWARRFNVVWQVQPIRSLQGLNMETERFGRMWREEGIAGYLRDVQGPAVTREPHMVDGFEKLAWCGGYLADAFFESIAGQSIVARS